MDDLDKSLTAAFTGSGKQRTLTSGLFLVTVDKLFQSQGYRAVTAWQEDDQVVVCVEYPEEDGSAWQSMMGIDVTEVQADLQAAAVSFVESYIDNQVNPPRMLWWSDVADHLLHVCETQAPDAIPILRETYGKYWQSAAVEVGYYLEHGEVKPQFEYLQEVQQAGDSRIYVYKLPRRRWRMGDPVTPYRAPLVEHVLPAGKPPQPLQ